MSAALGTDAARTERTPKDQAIQTTVNQSAGVSRERTMGAKSPAFLLHRDFPQENRWRKGKERDP